MYTVLPYNPAREKATTTTMAKGGMDNLQAAQFLDPAKAQEIKNYLLTAEGNLQKRPGITALFTVTGGKAITALEKYNSTWYLYGYGTKTAAYNTSTATSTVIKTYSGADRTFSIEKYGDYAFVASGIDKINRLSLTLAYDGQTVNFTVGSKLTGGTSGATATILEDADAGVTGTLTLGNISGTFQNNEAITDAAGGAAVADGTLTWVSTEITEASNAGIIRAIEGRLFAGRLETDPTAVAYSALDTGINPPFTNWTPVGTGSSDPGLNSFRNAGAVRAIEAFGNYIVVFADDGKWAWLIETIDSAGTLTKVDTPIISRLDEGGASGAITTPYGLFYANKSGIWQLLNIGAENIKWSDQETIISRNLGNTYFEDLTMTNADLVYVPKYQTILLTCGQNSDSNNHVIAYNLDLKALSYFAGWQINRFMVDGRDIYGGGVAATTVWTLFSGNSDDGNEIFTKYEQELVTGDLTTAQQLTGVYLQGWLSPTSSLDVKFDIYTNTGVKVEDKLSLIWTTSGVDTGYDGYGTGAWGESAWGGDSPESDMGDLVESFSGIRYPIRNYQRIILKIEEHSGLQHWLTWVRLITKDKAQIRRRNLTVNT